MVDPTLFVNLFFQGFYFVSHLVKKSLGEPTKKGLQREHVHKSGRACWGWYRETSTAKRSESDGAEGGLGKHQSRGGPRLAEDLDVTMGNITSAKVASSPSTTTLSRPLFVFVLFFLRGR